MLTEFLLRFTLDLGAEWVLWILVILSVINVLIMIERGVFYAKRKLNIQALRTTLEGHLKSRQYARAAKELEGHGETMQARVVLFGLREWERGEHVVGELMRGATATERDRYDRGLGFLGTIGNNAPFIGLFGTVLGIIGAFANLGSSGGQASEAVMNSISEALIATGVGLLVAIPAVVAFNIYKSKVKSTLAETELLGSTLIAYLEGSAGEMETDGATEGA